eukprot:COSAG01_NODE_4902_length_4641_cov_2.531484_4_plen_97_part_00
MASFSRGRRGRRRRRRHSPREDGLACWPASVCAHPAAALVQHVQRDPVSWPSQHTARWGNGTRKPSRNAEKRVRTSAEKRVSQLYSCFRGLYNRHW